MSDLGFALFETAIGRCGIVWSARGIAGVQFPERDERATRNRLLRRFPAAREAAAAGGRAARHRRYRRAARRRAARPEPRAARHCKRVPDFNRRVYDVARTHPRRRDADLRRNRRAAGRPHSGARGRRRRSAQNPFPIIVPCHRVLAAGGKTGGFSAPGGVRTKLRLLSIEGAAARRRPDAVRPAAAGGARRAGAPERRRVASTLRAQLM